MMYAYEFIARDRAGLLLVGNNGGIGEWIGEDYQFAEADFQQTYFEMEGRFFNRPTYE